MAKIQSLRGVVLHLLKASTVHYLIEMTQLREALLLVKAGCWWNQIGIMTALGRVALALWALLLRGMMTALMQQMVAAIARALGMTGVPLMTTTQHAPPEEANLLECVTLISKVQTSNVGCLFQVNCRCCFYSLLFKTIADVSLRGLRYQTPASIFDVFLACLKLSGCFQIFT